MEPDQNAYAPPKAREVATSGEADVPASALEVERRQHFPAEGHIRAVGMLSLVAGVAFTLVALVLLLAALREPLSASALLSIVLSLVCGVMGFVGGRALRRLEPLGRTLYALMLTLNFVGNSILDGLEGEAFQTKDLGRVVIAFAIAASLWNAKQAPVFTPYYQEVVAKTPDLVAPTARWIWWLLGIAGAAFLFGVGTAIMRRVG